MLCLSMIRMSYPQRRVNKITFELQLQNVIEYKGLSIHRHIRLSSFVHSRKRKGILQRRSLALC